jgi:hypothetical protein
MGSRNSLLDRVEQAREAVRDRFLQYLGATPAAGILAALAVGDQRAISNEEWRLFNLTGVTHLMSVSCPTAPEETSMAIADLMDPSCRIAPNTDGAEV